MMVALRIEWMYGAYHGQDPRTFDPDREACTQEEIKAWTKACHQAETGEPVEAAKRAGCLVDENKIVCRHGGLGIGAYRVVLTEEHGLFVRYATVDDLSREDGWEEEADQELEKVMTEWLDELRGENQTFALFCYAYGRSHSQKSFEMWLYNLTEKEHEEMPF